MVLNLGITTFKWYLKGAEGKDASYLSSLILKNDTFSFWLISVICMKTIQLVLLHGLNLLLLCLFWHAALLQLSFPITCDMITFLAVAAVVFASIGAQGGGSLVLATFTFLRTRFPRKVSIPKARKRFRKRFCKHMETCSRWRNT